MSLHRCFSVAQIPNPKTAEGLDIQAAGGRTDTRPQWLQWFWVLWQFWPTLKANLRYIMVYRYMHFVYPVSGEEKENTKYIICTSCMQYASDLSIEFYWSMLSTAWESPTTWRVRCISTNNCTCVSAKPPRFGGMKSPSKDPSHKLHKLFQIF